MLGVKMMLLMSLAAFAKPDKAVCNFVKYAKESTKSVYMCDTGRTVTRIEIYQFLPKAGKQAFDRSFQHGETITMLKVDNQLKMGALRRKDGVYWKFGSSILVGGLIAFPFWNHSFSLNPDAYYQNSFGSKRGAALGNEYRLLGSVLGFLGTVGTFVTLNEKF